MAKGKKSNLSTAEKAAMERFQGTAASGIFGNLLGETQARKQDVADRYALAGEEIAATEAAATGNINQAYGSAADRVQSAPVFYQTPSQMSAPMTAPMIGADRATMAALQAQADADRATTQGTVDVMYDLLRQSDAANRSSRLSDIDLGQASDIGALAALSSGQRFNLGRQQEADMQAIDNLLASIQQQEVTVDQGMVNQAITSFNNMINPIVDLLDPVSVIELWTEFSRGLGIPANQAMGALA